MSFVTVASFSGEPLYSTKTPLKLSQATGLSKGMTLFITDQTSPIGPVIHSFICHFGPTVYSELCIGPPLCSIRGQSEEGFRGRGSGTNGRRAVKSRYKIFLCRSNSNSQLTSPRKLTRFLQLSVQHGACILLETPSGLPGE